jgi:hypothetical protein
LRKPAALPPSQAIRFSVTARNFFQISNSQFSRRGAWCALFADGDAYGSCTLHLGNNHGARIHTGVAGYNKLFRLYPTYGGRTVPFALETAAAELTVHTRYGDVRFTFADENTICAEGDPGMGLRVIRQAEGYESLKRRRDGAWEAVPRATCAYLFKGTEGSAIEFDDTWDWHKLTCGENHRQHRTGARQALYPDHGGISVRGRRPG